MLGICSHPAAGSGDFRFHSDKTNPDFLDVASSYVRRLRSGDAVVNWRGEVTRNGVQLDLGCPLPLHDPSIVGVRTVCDLTSALSALNDTIDSRIASNSKVRAISELVDDLIQNGKGPVVIFTPGPDAAHHSVKEKMRDRGVSFGALDWFSNAPSVAKVLREFDSASFDVLVLDISRFSAGVSLSRPRSMVLVSPEEKVEAEVQAIGRVRRLGFKEDVLPVYRCIARGEPVEEHLSMHNMAEIESRLAQRPRDEAQQFGPVELPKCVLGHASSSSSRSTPLS